MNKVGSRPAWGRNRQLIVRERLLRLFPTDAAPCVLHLPTFHTHVSCAQVARQEGATLADLQAALQAFDRQYAATAAGPDKWRRHAEFMRDVYGAAVRDVAERSSQSARNEARDAAARAAQAEAALRQVHLQLGSARWLRQCAHCRAQLSVACSGPSHSEWQPQNVHIAVSAIDYSCQDGTTSQSRNMEYYFYTTREAGTLCRRRRSVRS